MVNLDDFFIMERSLTFELQQQLQQQQHSTDTPLAAKHEDTRCRMTLFTVTSLHRPSSFPHPVLPHTLYGNVPQATFLPTPSFAPQIPTVELPPTSGEQEQRAAPRTVACILRTISIVSLWEF